MITQLWAQKVLGIFHLVEGNRINFNRKKFSLQYFYQINILHFKKKF